ncbi:MAG: MFS transporter [Gemmataceae bacterium]|nr:MFS transporter [Gemmataceae bacterium]
MSYQPAENLNNRTFIGLITAQFLAGFNDQAIHVAAMFYAIHTAILSEAKAITLMPILFYAPWAIFCTLAGHFADRYSKTVTLRVWKFSEVLISLFLLLGFYLGSSGGMPHTGGWIVMSCVFLMGTHAAFFAPAKYGAMPEILRPHILSQGNGILESTTFLASILGTVSGGLLFNYYRDTPAMIAVVLLVLSVIGAGTSFMIAWLPAASPERLFPANLFKPLVENLKIMFRSRPLALAVLGIAFFVFMVSYMRASMLMHGETRNPRWNEQYTSLIVATVALGVGLGSPLAGYFSGGKIELGLVPFGCMGMTIALVLSAIALQHTAVLVITLIMIGFFSGFYMVPLYTLLQHRAPKKSKGELVATSNFINVTGAIAASILFFLLVQAGQVTNLTPLIQVQDKVAEGKITDIKYVPHKHGKIEKVTVETKDAIIDFTAKSKKTSEEIKQQQADQDGFREVLRAIGFEDDDLIDERTVSFPDNFFDVLGGALQIGDPATVSSYELRGVEHLLIRKTGQPLDSIYDKERLPRYLFLGAALMTVAILFLLWRKLPDFFVRTLFWFKSLGKYQLKAVGMQNLPTEGPVILATNCNNLLSCLQLVSATDRSTKVILIEDRTSLHHGTLLSWLAERAILITVKPGADNSLSWADAKREALETLQGGHLLAISMEHPEHAGAVAALMEEVWQQTGAPIVPVFCGAIDDSTLGVSPRVRVVFGESPATTSPETLRAEITKLGDWIRLNDDSAGSEHH